LHLLYTSSPKAISASELKKGILVSKPDVTRLLDRLVLKKLVQRETCEDNRRKVDILLTKEGKMLFEKAHNSSKEAIGNFFSTKISEEEAQTFRNILHKIRK